LRVQVAAVLDFDDASGSGDDDADEDSDQGTQEPGQHPDQSAASPSQDGVTSCEPSPTTETAILQALGQVATTLQAFAQRMDQGASRLSSSEFRGSQATQQQQQLQPQHQQQQRMQQQQQPELEEKQPEDPRQERERLVRTMSIDDTAPQPWPRWNPRTAPEIQQGAPKRSRGPARSLAENIETLRLLNQRTECRHRQERSDNQKTDFINLWSCACIGTGARTKSGTTTRRSMCCFDPPSPIRTSEYQPCVMGHNRDDHRLLV
jgi:hypothetical protein